MYWDRKVATFNNSLFISVPKDFAKAEGFEKGSPIRIELLGDGSLRIRLREGEEE